MPKVSVILPNYNHARFLPQRIESILGQTFGDFELLILDDASSDNSREVARRYAADPRVSFDFSDVNSGSPYLQWRKGLARTAGTYVWIAESDDFAELNLLQTLVERLDAHPNVGIATCDSWQTDSEGKPTGRYSAFWRATDSFADYDFSLFEREFVMNGREYCRRYMDPWNTIPNASAVVFRRAAFEAIGGPSTEMQLCGDWLTYCKILMQFDMLRVPEPLNHFRHHAVSVRTRTKSIDFLRESKAVHAYVAGQLGLPPDRHDRSIRVREFFSHALISAERDKVSHKVPMRRLPAVVREALEFGPAIVRSTLRILLREQASTLARGLGVRR